MRGGIGTDIHSIKPFLLDAIMGWCAVNKLTPILIAGYHIDRVVPDHLEHNEGNLAFNISQKAVIEKQITTQQITFTTYFTKHPHPAQIVLPTESWVAVRVKETGHHFDLSFAENTLAQDNTYDHIWPLGILLHQQEHMGNIVVDDMDVRLSKNTKKTGNLRLVWSNETLPNRQEK